jgi:hypothetical protein
VLDWLRGLNQPLIPFFQQSWVARISQLQELLLRDWERELVEEFQSLGVVVLG